MIKAIGKLFCLKSQPIHRASNSVVFMKLFDGTLTKKRIRIKIELMLLRKLVFMLILVNKLTNN